MRYLGVISKTIRCVMLIFLACASKECVKVAGKPEAFESQEAETLSSGPAFVMASISAGVPGRAVGFIFTKHQTRAVLGFHDKTCKSRRAGAG